MQVTESTNGAARAAQPDRRTYSVLEVMAATGLGRTTVYKLLSTGGLQSVRVGRRRLILAESVDELLNGGA